MDISGDTLQLLRALVVAVEGNKDVPDDADGRVRYAEGIALKCFIHAASVLYLSRSTTVPELGVSFFDPASMNALARAAIESFLVFHYVIAAPQAEAEGELRYLSWVLADLMERQELPATLQEEQERPRQEKHRIESIKSRIQQNVAFKKLTPKQQKKLLQKKEWRRQSWAEIAKSAGLSQLHSQRAYRYLCSYAHSGSLSVMQVSQARTKTDQQFLAQNALRLVNVALAFMAEAYCSMFPKARAALANETELTTKVDEWIQLGKKA